MAPGGEIEKLKAKIRSLERKIQKIELGEARFKKYFEMGLVGIAIVGADGEWIDVNQELCRMLGYKKSELLNKSFLGITHPDDLAESSKHYKEVLEGKKEEYRYEKRYVHKKGNVVFVEIAITCIRSKTGTVEYFVGMVRDLSDTKRYEKELNRQQVLLEDLFASIHEGIGLVDENENIVFCNPAFAKIFEEDLYLLPGQNLLDFFPEEEKKVIMKQTRSRQGGQESIYEIKVKTRKGNEKTLRVYVSPRFDRLGTYLGAYGTVLDITERVNIERDFIAAKLKAEESDQLKSAFLANMSHEIRTPLSGILGFTQLLSRNLHKGKDERNQKFLEVIEGSGKHLLKIIEDIIDISKIDAGQIKLSPGQCNINKIIFQVYNILVSDSHAKGKEHIKLKLEKSLPDEKANIVADELRLRQILTNLGSNALKFTHEGYVKIEYRIEDEGKTLHFIVKDTGIGLAEDKLEVIFDRFRQADEGTTREYGGTGLGLSICKSLVDLMGGKIWVESTLGQGATFHVKVPVVFREYLEMIAKPTDPNKTMKYNWKDKTILVVEDDMVNMEYLTSILEETGVNILMAVNGKEAVNFFQKENEIDLVLMDIQLPVMNGLDATRAIKEISPGVCVIAQTAYAFPEDKTKCFDAGCNYYITKPFESGKLLPVIDCFIGKGTESAGI